jgi:HEAT repeat protein
VVIKSSSSRQIDTLMADLMSERQVVREGAIARLTVIGGRAVERLTAFLDTREAAPRNRVAALRTLEAIADQRALDASLRAIDDPDAGVAQAAVRVARVFLRGPRGATVVDRLTEVALNRARSEPIRLAAIDALSTLESSTLQPLRDALKDDPSEEVRALAQRTRPLAVEPGDHEGYLRQAVERRLPDDPVALRHAIAQAAGPLSLPLLHQLVERIRDREREAGEAPAVRAEWMAARAAAHVALASRGSRLALYDIRETLETAAGPLPVEFLSALTAVGDASCLEPIAAAFDRAAASGGTRDDWWHRHLASAFRVIVARERVTRRHQVARKIDRRWKGVLTELWPGRR